MVALEFLASDHLAKKQASAKESGRIVAANKDVKSIQNEVEKRAKAMLTAELKKRGFTDTVGGSSSSGPSGGGRWCNNCKVSSHTDATCWKLHPDQRPDPKKKGDPKGKGGKGGDPKKATGKAGITETAKEERKKCETCGKEHAGACWYRPVDQGGKGGQAIGKLAVAEELGASISPGDAARAESFLSFVRGSGSGSPGSS